jgi:hypothetical protein
VQAMVSFRKEGYGHVRQAEVMCHVARALGWPFVDLEGYSPSCGMLAKVSAAFACRTRCVPVVFNKHRVVLVVDDPVNGAYLMANPQLMGPPHTRSVEVALTTPAALDMALRKRIEVVKG